MKRYALPPNNLEPSPAILSRRRDHITMKIPKSKLIGMALLTGAMLAAIGFQIFSTGLIYSSPPILPYRTFSDGRYLWIVQMSPTVIHTVRLWTLTGVAMLGFAFLFYRSKHGTDA